MAGNTETTTVQVAFAMHQIQAGDETLRAKYLVPTDDADPPQLTIFKPKPTVISPVQRLYLQAMSSSRF
jgi:hypothetical protein